MGKMRGNSDYAVKNAKPSSRVQLEGEGTYECSVTGLVFEASERVLVRYSVLSWSKYGAFLRDSWKFAGPIFNVDTVNKDASVLKSIQFPHSVCLYDPDNEMTFSVLHLKDNRPVIEPTVDHSGSHVKWNVTSLSPLGPIIKTSQPVEHHGVVLVYKQLGSDDNNCSFHIYLATNSSSDIKDICKQVRGYKNRYFRIEKPPTCKLDEGTYRLLSEPEGDIKPQAVMTHGQDMSEKQLLQLAKRLGKEWKQVAIYLDLNSRDLDDIQAAEKDVTMQKLKMLVEWKSRRMSGEATPYHLLKSVEELDDLPNEVRQILQDLINNQVAK
ncbi:hypothetical protein F2P81_017098 [Scophthalmus maximus]|uniref:Uncharacterized protein n=1 Tax=Scophthalmus maximus TaxID=52904 RepID=A0A6A4SAX8_SCOMX|nr:hypothetical protein F2P81_017098 [Scophthalmus maximus]